MKDPRKTLGLSARRGCEQSESYEDEKYCPDSRWHYLRGVTAREILNKGVDGSRVSEAAKRHPENPSVRNSGSILLTRVQKQDSSPSVSLNKNDAAF